MSAPACAECGDLIDVDTDAYLSLPHDQAVHVECADQADIDAAAAEEDWDQ